MPLLLACITLYERVNSCRLRDGIGQFQHGAFESDWRLLLGLVGTKTTGATQGAEPIFVEVGLQ